MVELIKFILIIFILIVLLSFILFSISEHNYNKSKVTIISKVIEMYPGERTHPYRYCFLVESSNKILKLHVSGVQYNLFSVGDRVIYKRHNGYTIIKKDIS